MKFLQEQQEFLERGMSDLKRQLETEMEVFRRPALRIQARSCSGDGTDHGLS